MRPWNPQEGDIGFKTIDSKSTSLVSGIPPRPDHSYSWKVEKDQQSTSPHGLRRRRKKISSDNTVIGIGLGWILLEMTDARYAFSDNAPSPMSAGVAIDVLQAALPKANISTSRKPGWILVSHGVGGLYSEVLAARHTNQVKGMMFVDAVPESAIPKVFTPGRTFKLLLRGIIAPLGIDRLSAWIFKHRTREDRVWGVSSWRSDRVIRSQFQESLAAGAITRNEVIAAEATIPKSVPVVVISSGKSCKDKDWEEGQRHLADKATKRIWDVVENADHDVWRNEDGKTIMKRRLSELVLAATLRP
jgi:pimeloyl-ACP methyl ester carboxylesterase